VSTIPNEPISIDDIWGKPEFYQDPYPFYRALRANGPVQWSEQGQNWEIFGYAEAAAALRDQRLAADRSTLFFNWMDPERRATLEPLERIHQGMMLFSDPPNHTRLRGLVNKGFTPRVVDGLRDRIQGVVDDLLVEPTAAGGMDVIASLAEPLPVIVIAQLLGVPIEDRVDLKRWSAAFAAFIGGQAGVENVPEWANEGIVALVDYLREIVERRRVEPGGDLISALLAAEERGDVLSENELLATCILVLIAGHETTTNLIGNGLLALLRHPEQAQRLRADPSLTRTAIEELLRYDSPVQLTSRLAVEPVELGGQTIEAGRFVDIWLGPANRDPAQFVDPETLDLRRAENRHLAFGYGPHFCVGAPLARLEGQIALSTLLARFPAITLESTPLEYQQTTVFRALRRLPVAW
jgi:pimeloyl-[acyl-carrier protein] synthase